MFQSRHPNRKLARWVVKQRVAYREHRLEEWQIERLVSVNFEFERGDLDRRNRKYMAFNQARSLVRSLRFHSLDDYFLWARGDHGNGKFPQDLPRSPQHVYRDNGWTNWSDFLGTSTKVSRDEEAWNEMFLRYGEYVEKHGVGKINWKEAGLKLSHWVNTQRQFQREGRLSRRTQGAARRTRI